MSSEEAKNIVNAGLQRRRDERKIAEQEERLEQYELDMIGACNENCADARKQRMKEENSRMNQEQAAARQAARETARVQAQALENSAVKAVKRYAMICLVILWMTAWTNLPFWAAVTLILGLAVFPAVYIFRLYYPIVR